MPVMFSLMEMYNNPYIPALARYKCVNIKNYFCDSVSQKTYSELVSECEDLVAEMSIGQDAVNQVELTSSVCVRSGSLTGTASVLSEVCHANISAPPYSLVKKICEQGWILRVPSIQWGLKNEVQGTGVARQHSVFRDWTARLDKGALPCRHTRRSC